MHKISCPHTPQQNGLAERKHRHIVEVGLSLLAEAGLPNKFWDDAFITAVHLINLLRGSPSSPLQEYMFQWIFLRAQLNGLLLPSQARVLINPCILVLFNKSNLLWNAIMQMELTSVSLGVLIFCSVRNIFEVNQEKSIKKVISVVSFQKQFQHYFLVFFGSKCWQFLIRHESVRS